ncbi:hypothetical protein EC971742_1890, partial [Escherichia coli 97.1742]
MNYSSLNQSLFSWRIWRTDSMAMWRENNIDIVECVKCGHQMREADKEA